MSKETTKANRRRASDPIWRSVFSGIGCDIYPTDSFEVGQWPEISQLLEFTPEHGDANYFMTYWPRRKFNFLHATAVLNSTHNPLEALKDWLKAVQIGGYIVATVPDFYLYDHGRWPSKFNGNSKSTWSLTRPKSPCPLHQWVNGSWLTETLGLTASWALEPKLIDTNYNYELGPDVDQTANPDDGVECWIELVIRRDR